MLVALSFLTPSFKGLQASIVSAVSQLVQSSTDELRESLIAPASKLVWVLCSTSRTSLADPLLDTLATLAPSAVAPRQCIVDVAALSSRKSDLVETAHRLITPALAGTGFHC